MDKLLKKYWFEFEDRRINVLLIKGVGITAYSYEDALSILKTELFENELVPPIKDFVENINVLTLDENHIRPNMGPVSIRGIWYPFLNLR